jgi:translation initiation factor 2 gamma subunit (eIF-2gamma)
MNQPLLNIGTLGSVSDGKSTLIYQLTGIKTQRHS